MDSGQLKIRKRELRILQLERDKKRSRKLLTIDEPEGDEQGIEHYHLINFAEEVEELDLKDIDFKMSHSAQELSKTTGKNLSKQDINVIKLILCSG